MKLHFSDLILLPDHFILFYTVASSFGLRTIQHQVKVNVKIKVKVSIEQATKAQRGSRCIALLFLQPQR